MGHRYGVTGAALARRGGADLAVAHDLRHLLFLHIHGAELPVDRRFERGIGLHAAAGGQLEIAIPAYR